MQNPIWHDRIIKLFFLMYCLTEIFVLLFGFRIMQANFMLGSATATGLFLGLGIELLLSGRHGKEWDWSCKPGLWGVTYLVAVVAAFAGHFSYWGLVVSLIIFTGLTFRIFWIFHADES